MLAYTVPVVSERHFITEVSPGIGKGSFRPIRCFPAYSQVLEGPTTLFAIKQIS